MSILKISRGIQSNQLLCLILCIVPLLLVISCSGTVSYKPPLLPVKFTLDSRGNVQISGETSLATCLGTFSVGAKYSLDTTKDSLTVILRDTRRHPLGFDTIYSIKSDQDEFSAIINGRTSIQIVNRQVLIDISSASIETIEFKRIQEPVKITDNGLIAKIKNIFLKFVEADNQGKDHFLLSLLKGFIIIFVLAISIFLSGISLLIDLILLFFGYTFPCLTYIWNDVVWIRVIMNWYWNNATTLGAILGNCIIIPGGIGLLVVLSSEES